MSNNIITITDGIIGSSQKNVRGLGESIHVLVSKDKGLILASAASHDAILFSSQLPMKEFIHEGTGNLWHRSLHDPSRYAKYIIMRSNDDTDVVSKAMKDVPNFTQHFEMIYDGDFADLYKRTNILTPGVR